MSNGRANLTKHPKPSTALLLVGASSSQVERKAQLLHDSGFHVTHAESICHAELYSEAQYFDAAVYDESMTEVEQVSLARIMRVRWPWMRLVRCGHSAITITKDAIFDATVASETSLPETVLKCLIF